MEHFSLLMLFEIIQTLLGKIHWNYYLFQDAPEGVHKPADGQLNKSSHSSVLPDISSSRRSSSAPLHHHYRTNNEVASGSPVTGTSNAVSTGNSGSSATFTTEKTNAETQTALRGVAILENTECQAKAQGANCNESNRDHNTVFFTECECKRKNGSGSSQAANSNPKTSSSKKPKHSTSTPNISMQSTMSTASRISRKEQLTKKASSTSVKTSENNRPEPVNRNHSFSPSSRRRRSELPGSPDDQPPERLRPKRRNTVVSPIHVIHKKIWTQKFILKHSEKYSCLSLSLSVYSHFKNCYGFFFDKFFFSWWYLLESG